jgi:peptidoglycan/xylan/chitin deacetylase (PgdA/CDA1 family)
MRSVIKIAKRVRKILSPHALVLMYHRIADPVTDPWDLSVSAENFDQQLGILSKKWKVISLPQLVDKLQKGHLEKNTVAISFDDGYLDNFTVALPILEKYGLPASFFIPSYNIEDQQPYWWDVLEDLVFNTAELPAVIELHIKGEKISLAMGEEAVLTMAYKDQYKNWKGTNEPVLKRCQLYVMLWSRLKTLEPPEQRESMQQLRSIFKTNTGAGIELVNKKQLKELGNHPLCIIGAHTTHHIMLAAHNYAKQEQEITGGKNWLSEVLDREVDLISYPYGSYDRDTLDIVGKANFKAAFTTDPKPVSRYTNHYALGRFQVCNWSPVQFENQLQQWNKKIL